MSWPGQEVTAEPTSQGGFIEAPGFREEQAREDRATARDTEQDRLKRIDIYRKEFLSSPEVKGFRDVQSATEQILGLANAESSPASDIALIISYMKALDPGSVVREGEIATAQNAGGVPTQIRNTYNQLVNGEKLTPEQRQNFADTAVTVYDSRRSAFDNFAGVYRGLVEGEGGDPEAQGIRLSQDLAGLPEEEGFVPGAVAETGLQNPETVGGIARGDRAELGIDRWMRNDTFDRQAYLEETYDISPNDESRITAFWNTNRNNPNLTVENVRAWYEQNNYPAPTDDAIAQTIETARQGAPFSGIDTTQDEAAYLELLDEAIASRGDNPEEISDTVGVLGAQGITLGALDELTGAGAAAVEALQGGDPIAAYQAERDIVRRQAERSREANPGTAFASEIIGGVATGGGAAARTAVQSGARAAAKEGAKVGALAGFNYGEGAADSLAGAAVGVPLGAAAGAGGDKLVRAVQAKAAQRVASRAPSAGREVIEAADNFNAATGSNVRPLPADVGGATTRRATGGAAQTTFGARPIVDAAQRNADEAQAGVQAIAQRQGQVPQSKQEAGEVAIKGAEKAMKQAKTRVDSKYAKARQLAGGERVPIPTTQEVLRKEIADMQDTPGGAKGVEYFQDLIGKIDGDYPIDGIKRFRGDVRDRLLKDGLRGSEMEARAMRVIDAADFDIEQGLVNAGKAEAAAAYKEASQAASERFSMIDDVMTPILGRKGEKSGEQVFQSIERLSRGDAKSLGQFMKALPKEEAGSIRGVIIDRLGRSTKGRQDADGQAFSLNDFLTRWNDEGMSKAAKGVLFDGETRAALNSLARVAQGTKESQRFANSSNTGGANLFNALVNGAPIGAVFYDPLTAAAGAGAAVGAQMISGRLLASPSFARWLAKMPKQKTPAAAEAHVKRLDRIAAADSVIATEALGLQRQLMAVFETGPARLAADPGERSGENTTTEGAQQ